MRTLLNTKKLLNNVLGVTEMTFLTKRVMFHPLKQKGMCLNGGYRRLLHSKSKYIITLYNYIYIYYIYINMYLIHISQYMLRYLFILRSF